MNYDTEKYKIMKLPHPLLLHWILNPGLAFNEIFLGQRIPAVTLIDKTSDASLLERQYIPCPECGEIHNAKLWTRGNAFGHWLGYICPSCKGTIPCLWNFTSLLLLVVLLPIWLPLRLIFEKKYIDFEVARLTKHKFNIEATPGKFLWLKMGIFFGFFMFLFLLFMQQMSDGFSGEKMAIVSVICVAGGALFGGAMWLFMGRKKNKN